jgi:hypothetical protein
MRKPLRLAPLIAVLAGLAAGATLPATRDYVAAEPGTGEVWSTKKVMDKVHVGKQSLFSLVYRDIHRAEPDWKTDDKNIAEIIRLMSMLSRQKPSTGSQEAWDKLVRYYIDNANTARQNVKEHKLEPARTSLQNVLSTCDECHDNHGIK